MTGTNANSYYTKIVTYSILCHYGRGHMEQKTHFIYLTLCFKSKIGGRNALSLYKA